MENLIEVRNLTKIYTAENIFSKEKNHSTLALNNVSLNIKKGEILGLVGESGSGKSTLGNCILRLLQPTRGEILYNGENIMTFDKKKLINFRRNAQVIFQNPYSSLNPKMKIKDILEEPLIIHKFENKKEREEKIYNVLELTGLNKEDLNRYPHEFSGGQRQRIAIARALILEPEFIVADEPVSALDVSIQAQILNLLKDLKEKLNLTYLFISHDLNVVHYLCDNVIIMNKGEIVERGNIDEVFNNPQNDYTKTLLNSIPVINI